MSRILGNICKKKTIYVNLKSQKKKICNIDDIEIAKNENPTKINPFLIYFRVFGVEKRVVLFFCVNKK